MKDKVVQLTPKLVQDLKDRRILTDNEDAIPLELHPVQQGERVIGTLTTEESKVFLELFNLQDDLEHWDKELTRRSFLKAADMAIEDDAPSMMSGVIVAPELFLAENEAREYYEMQYRFKYLQEMLWYNLRSRLDVFHYFLGIRKGFIVVDTGHKFSDAREPA